MSINFIVVDFVFGNEDRGVSIRMDGDIFDLNFQKISDTDLWMVPSAVLEKMLGNRFREFYPMFFGILLDALSNTGRDLPTRRISLDEIDEAYEKGALKSLAAEVATGH